MAKKVVVETSNPPIYSGFSWWQTALVGAGLGVVILALSWLVGTYVVDPLLCRSGTLRACAQSDVLAGNIAAVIGAVVGAAALIRLRTHFAIWVAIATLVSFWNFTTLTDGLRWFEAAAWTAIAYALAYLLFTNIFRIRSVFVAVIVAIITTLVLRWVAFL